MSWNGYRSYDIKPFTLEYIKEMIDILVEIYPNETTPHRTPQECAISRAFHERLIDDVEMEYCYEYFCSGRLLA